MDVVVDSKILTQKETSDVIIKFLGSSVTSPDGFLETERAGSLLRCCRYNNFVSAEAFYGFDPDILHPVKLTVQ